MSRTGCIIVVMAILLLHLAQPAKSEIKPIGVDVRVNTVDAREIQIRVVFSEAMNDSAVSAFVENNQIEARFLSLNDGSDIWPVLLRDSVKIIPALKDISFRILLGDSATDPLTFQKILEVFSGKEPAYLTINRDIRLFPDNPLTPDSGSFLTTAWLEKETLKKLSLSDEQVSMLKRASTGDQRFFKQYFDVAREIDEEDTTKASYVLDYAFGRSFGSDIFFSSQGRISTRPEDNLNRLEFNLGLTKTGPRPLFDSAVFWSPTANVALMTDQQFDTALVKLRIGFEGLVPNIIDLTGGNVRLKLKPYLKAGLGIVGNLPKNPNYTNDEATVEIFFGGYYYIPVLEKLAIIAEGEGQFVNVNGRSGLDNFTYSYKASLGYDLPLEDLKALITWESGRDQFTITDDSQLLIGILLNQLSF